MPTIKVKAKDLDTENDPGFLNIWSAIATYSSGEEVIHQDLLWQSNTATSAGEEPGVSPKWELPAATPDYASQVEAEAGTENTKIMTALRVSEAIAALGGGGGAYVAPSNIVIVNPDRAVIVGESYQSYAAALDYLRDTGTVTSSVLNIATLPDDGNATGFWDDGTIIDAAGIRYTVTTSVRNVGVSTVITAPGFPAGEGSNAYKLVKGSTNKYWGIMFSGDIGNIDVEPFIHALGVGCAGAAVINTPTS